jgi:hypothetical protein
LAQATQSVLVVPLQAAQEGSHALHSLTAQSPKKLVGQVFTHVVPSKKYPLAQAEQVSLLLHTEHP